MISKKTSIKTKQSYNHELNRVFDSTYLYIQNKDISASLKSIYMLKEYIRYSYFENYIFRNKKNLSKYCKLILSYEKSNKPILIKACRESCKIVLNDAMNGPYTTKTIDLCLELAKSNYEDIENLSNQLMRYALGSKVRGISF